MRRIRAPRTLRITREGRYYLGFTFGVGIAATNTGNNLLYLILGMLLALIIVSGLLSEAALRRLTVTRMSSGPFRALEPGLSGLVLRNDNRLLPSIGIEIDEVPVPEIESAPGRCLRIPAGGSARASLRLTPRRRGEIVLIGLKVTTRYPFGIFAKSRRYEIPAKLLAWPARIEARGVAVNLGREEIGPPVARRGGTEDLRGLRSFREGDETRLVHWRRSLRVGQMVVVERDALEGRRVVLRLAPGRGEPFEEAVRIAASRAEDHLARGDEVALEAPAGFSVGFGSGPGHRRRLFSALALVPESDSTEPVDGRPEPDDRSGSRTAGAYSGRTMGARSAALSSKERGSSR